MGDGSGRTVTACVTYGDAWLGAVGPFEVANPFWAEMAPITRRLRTVLGAPVPVLRLVRMTGGRSPRFGNVVYHVAALERPKPFSPAPPPSIPKS